MCNMCKGVRSKEGGVRRKGFYTLLLTPFSSRFSAGGSISRILSSCEVLIIYLGRPLLGGSSSRLWDGNERVTLSLSDLAPDGVYLAALVTKGTGRLLPYRFTLTPFPRCTSPSPASGRGKFAVRQTGRGGGLLSVALVVALHAQPLAGITPCGVRTFLVGLHPHD